MVCRSAMRARGKLVPSSHSNMVATTTQNTNTSLVQIATSVKYSKPARPTERLYVKVPSFETNLEQIPTPVTVTCSRGLSTSLDVEGFQTFTSPSHVEDWGSKDEILNVCYKETVDLVKKATGAKSAAVFDHTIRRAPGAPPNKAPARDPVFFVHADYTFESAEKRLADFYGPTADQVKQGRWAIVNAWRPIAGTVQDIPLGFIDSSSVAASDLVPYDLVYPDRVGGNLAISHNPNHKWYFYHHQTPDEVHIFKQFDSRQDVARIAPHTGFEDPTKPADGFIPRESIELRVFVFYDMDLGLPIFAEEQKSLKQRLVEHKQSKPSKI